MANYETVPLGSSFVNISEGKIVTPKYEFEKHEYEKIGDAVHAATQRALLEDKGTLPDKGPFSLPPSQQQQQVPQRPIVSPRPFGVTPKVVSPQSTPLRTSPAVTIESNYRLQKQAEERARLERFANDESRPFDISQPSTAAQPAAAPKPKPEPGFVARTAQAQVKGAQKVGEAAIKGGEATIKTAVKGYNHFTKGLYDAVGGQLAQPSDYYTPWQVSKDVASGIGEAALGGLTMMFALPMGAGHAVKTAIESYSPGLDQTPIIPGFAAMPIRAFMGLPMLLDPEFRAALGDPERRQKIVDDLSQPMTFGQVMENATMLATGGVQARVIHKLRQTPTLPKDTPSISSGTGYRGNTSGIGVKALPPGVVKHPESSMPPEGVAARLMVIGEELTSQTPLTPKQTSTARGSATAPPAKPIPTATLGPRSTVSEATPPAVEIPLKTSGEKAMAETSHFSELQSSFEVATRRANDIIREELTREMVEAEMKAIEASPSVVKPSGITERPKGVVEDIKPVPMELSISPPKAEAVAPKAEIPNIQEIAAKAGVETAAIERYVEKGGDLTNITDILDAAEASKTGKAGIVETEAGLINKATGEVLTPEGQPTVPGVEGPIAKWPNLTPILPKKMRDAKGRFKKAEGGFANIEILSNMAVGAVVGGTQGDTPEERLHNMLAAMGIGVGIAAVGGKTRLVNRLMMMFKDEAPRVLDTSNPVIGAYKPAKPKLKIENPKSGDLTATKIIANEGFIPRKDIPKAKHIEVQATQQVFGIARDIVKGTKEWAEGSLKEAMLMASDVHKRIERVHKAQRGMEGRTIRANEELIKIQANRFQTHISDADLASIITKLPRQSQVSLASRLYFAMPDSIMQMAYNAMLSGKAGVKNIAGNLPMLPIGLLDRSLASLAFWNPNRARFSESVSGAVALWDSTLNQLSMLRNRHFWDELGKQAEQTGATHYELQARGMETIAELVKETGAESIGKGIEWFNNAVSVGPNVMARTDGMFKVLNRDMYFGFEAMRQAHSEGLTGFQALRRSRELSRDFSQFPKEIREAAREFGAQQTFTREFASDFMKGAQYGFEDPIAQMLYRLSIAPFVRTPMRLIEVGAEYTPILGFISKHARNEWNKGGVARDTVIARMATGSLLMGSFYYLASQNLITGTEPTDPRLFKANKDLGIPPLSFWNPVTNRYHSYAGMQPLTTFIALGANLARTLHNIEDDDTAANAIFTAGLAMYRAIDSSDFFQGVSEFIDAVRQGRTDDDWSITSLRFIRKKMEMFNPAILREIENVIDPEQKRVLYDKAFDNEPSFVNSIKRELNMLGQSYGRVNPFTGQFLTPDRNMFSGEILSVENLPMQPATSVAYPEGAWADELRRLKGAGLKRLSPWIGHPQALTSGFEATVLRPGIRLSFEQLDRLEVLHTQVVKDSNGNLIQSLDALVKSERYQKMPDITKQDMIQNRWNGFREKAIMRLMQEDPSLRAELYEKRKAVARQRKPQPPALSTPPLLEVQ